jgi:hypothetical protein
MTMHYLWNSLALVPKLRLGTHSPRSSASQRVRPGRSVATCRADSSSHPSSWSVVAVLIALLTFAGALSADDAPATPPAADAPAAPTAETPAPAAAPTPAPPPAPPPIDQQPYRVLVAVGIAPDPDLDATFRRRLIDGLRARIATRLGPLWVADVEAPDWLAPGRAQVLDQFTEPALKDRFVAAQYDKVFLATLEQSGSALKVAAREWDKSSQTATAVTSSLVYEPRIVIDALFTELLTHFRPVAAIETVAEGGLTVELRLHGGELLPPDPDLRPLANGAYLRPYFRYLNRKKELQGLQSLPWTYLHVTDVDRGRFNASVDSVFSGVLAGKRRNTQVMAIAVKPRFEATQVLIIPRGQPDNPHSGVRVEVLNRKPTAEDPVQDRLTLFTDRLGAARIPADAGHPLRYVYIMSGKSVLATVPFIPGDQPRVELEIPDDSARLAVEGELAILEAELIEIVARREVTAARTLGVARGGNWEQADKLVAELKDLPTSAVIKDRLERIRLPAVAAVKKEKNRAAEFRINSMCQTFAASVDQFLNPDRMNAILTEVRELKEAVPKTRSDAAP